MVWQQMSLIGPAGRDALLGSGVNSVATSLNGSSESDEEGGEGDAARRHPSYTYPFQQNSAGGDAMLPQRKEVPKAHAGGLGAGRAGARPPLPPRRGRLSDESAEFLGRGEGAMSLEASLLEPPSPPPFEP